MTRWRNAWPLIAAAAIAAAWLAAGAGLGQRLEYAVADLRTELLRHEVDSDVVIVGIDAASLAELREWPWPRRHHADLIDRIAPAMPRHLFLDIDFSSRSDEANDGALEGALADWPGAPVILPAFQQQVPSSPGEMVRTAPLPRLARHAAIASVNLEADGDGLVRSVRRAWTADGVSIPTVATTLGDLGPSEDAEIPIDYTIDPGSFAFISYADILAGRVPAVHFADKTVFVGATAIELGDTVPVPVYGSLPGVVVQALALESIRDGLLAPTPTALYWVLVAAWATLLAWLFQRLSWRRNSALTALCLAVPAAASLVAHAHADTILPVVPFAVATLAAYLLSTLRSLEAETLRAIVYAMGFRKRDALLKSIVLSSTDCIVCIDSRGIVKTANPAAARLFGCDPRLLVGRPIFAWIPGLLDDDPGTGASRSFDDLSESVSECVARADDGNEFPVELSMSPVELDDERLYTAIVRDISERHAQQRQLQFQATHDPLTTLPNRPALAAHLDSLLANRELSRRIALLMIDLNRFKEVNDTLGHNIGDYVLHEVARRLAQVSADRGFIARIGGDEFALVLDEFRDTDEIESLSQRLVDCLKPPVETCGISIDVGLSIGIARYPADAASAEDLFRHSDVAMYVAKRSSSGFEFYDSANDTHSLRRLAIVSKLRNAIATDRLELHYQPQVNLHTGDVDSVEALLRWEDPALGRVNPDEFISLAETTDLIEPLSTWTLRTALRQAERWHAGGRKLRVAINISARMLQDVGFPGRVERMLDEFGVDPGYVELEITESAMMIDPQRALRVTEDLSRLGCMISIDDYGTGYSSLAYLRDLPAHALKLDKSFVVNMLERAGDRVIVASTVQMAHALDLKVVAEGVETEADASLLAELGYDYAQGYLYSKALDADALAAWIRELESRRHARAACL